MGSVAFNRSILTPFVVMHEVSLLRSGLSLRSYWFIGESMSPVFGIDLWGVTTDYVDNAAARLVPDGSARGPCRKITVYVLDSTSTGMPKPATWGGSYFFSVTIASRSRE